MQYLHKNQFGSQLPNGSNIFKIQFPDCLLYRNRQKIMMKGWYVHVEITPSAVVLLEGPGRPCLLAVCLHRHPIKCMAIETQHISPLPLHGSRAHIVRQPPNKHHNKQKCVISQETGWNPIYPLFKRFFWTFKLLYFHYFPTIEHHISSNQIHSLFWSLMSKEQYIKNSCIDLLNTQWIRPCSSVWIFQCHANKVQNRGLTFHEILIAHYGIFIFKTRRFFPTSMPASQCIGRVAPKWSQLMQRGR